jgi:hypothetical protein
MNWKLFDPLSLIPEYLWLYCIGICCRRLFWVQNKAKLGNDEISVKGNNA